MNNWLGRLFTGKQSTTKAVVQTPLASSDALTDSVAQRRRGNELLDRGDLQGAIDCYHKALASDPNSCDAYTSLGFALNEKGDLVGAQAAFQRAATLQPDSFDPIYLLGRTCIELREFSKAVNLFEKALALQPRFESLYGELCHALFQINDVKRAREVIGVAISKYPENASFRFFLGNLESFSEEWPRAVDSYKSALKLNPKLVQAHTNLAAVFRVTGNLDAAELQTRLALEVDPVSADVQACLAANMDAKGCLAEALESYDKALRMNTGHAGLHRGQGKVLFRAGRLEEAIESFKRALGIEPDSAETYRDLGLVFLELGRHGDAEQCSRKALALRSDYPSAENNLGMALQVIGKLFEAEKCYRKALSTDPRSDVYLSNLGGVQLAQGRLSEAADSFRQATLINPNFLTAHANLLYCLSIDQKVSGSEYLIQAREFGTRLQSVVGPAYSEWLVDTDNRCSRPLRVGLVSGRFCNNPVGYFLESVLANIDSTRVQLVAYATSAKVDELTERIRSYFVQWESIAGLQANTAAEKIRSDRIDILVDLNGCTEGNLLPVFALKPAPLQVSWLGYWASTGLPQMDYVLADQTSLHVTDKDCFSEAICYLPETRFCFSVPPFEIPVAPLPAARNGFVTFGCFQSLSKINDHVLKLWGQVLQALPSARLRLAFNQVNDAEFQHLFRQRLLEAGVDPARVTLLGPVPRAEYLASYREVDLILDTFPYTGGTTTCEALWMGVPTLTLKGNSVIGRQGASMLGCVGLDQWIAVDETDYLAKAVSFARDQKGLETLRHSLRSRVLGSALFDAPRFARNLEDAFKAIWEQNPNLARRPLQSRDAPSSDLANTA